MRKMKMWSKLLVAGAMLFSSVGIISASTIDEVMDASYKIYKDNVPICSGTIVNTPKTGEQLLVTSAHCLVDLDKLKEQSLVEQIHELEKTDLTIKKVFYNEKMEPTIERVYYLKHFNYMISPEIDMALLSLKDPTIKLPAVDVATDEELKDLKIGDGVATAGFPLGFDFTVTFGHFSGKVRSSRDPINTVVYRYTAPSTYGNSGGGLYRVTNDGEYKLIGVVSHVLDGTVGKGIPMGFLNFAIPALHLNDGMNFIDNFNGTPVPPGVTVQ